MSAPKTLTTLEYALLCLLNGKESSAYDIKQLFETTPIRQFSSSPGSIYPALDRLEARGLTSSRLDQTGRTRARRIFSLTEKGHEKVISWLSEPPTKEEVATDIRVPLLRFGFMEGQVSHETISQYLDEFERLLISYLEKLKPYRDDFERMGVLHATLNMENGLRATKTHIDWCRYARTQLAKTPSSPPSR